MTDPRTRRPKFWRNFAWAFAITSIVMLVGGLYIVVNGNGNWTGWLDVGLSVLFGSQSVLYYRQYQRAKREQDDI